MLNTIPTSLALLNLQHFQTMPNLTNLAASYQGLVSVAANLQATIIKQQAVIDTLMKRINSTSVDVTDIFKESRNNQVKLEEAGAISPLSAENITAAKTSSQGTIDSCEESSEDGERKQPKIARRFGFKAEKKNLDNDDNSKVSDKLKNSSNAKHLWVNYGRRIIEYAMNQTTGNMQVRVKQLAGKLNSKKDFERTFQVEETDSEEDKEFKTALGKLAIYFVKQKASPTFESSKYKEQMITQRHVVAAWIERLIGE